MSFIHASAIGSQELQQRIERLCALEQPRYRRLWAYYRNPLVPQTLEAGESGSERPYRQGQEWGLPSRITGLRAGREVFGASRVGGVARKEIVIENDIGWRIDTAVDYLFGRPLVIESTAPDPRRRALLGALMAQILEHNGGILFLQQLALLSAVYGFVDVLVKFQSFPVGTGPTDGSGASAAEASADPSADSLRPNAGPAPSAPVGPAELPRLADTAEAGATPTSPDAQLARIARCIRLEIVEPARALPFLAADHWQTLRAYGQSLSMDAPADAPPTHAPLRGSWLQRMRQSMLRLLEAGGAVHLPPRQLQVTQIIYPDRWVRYHDGQPVAGGANDLGQIPLVHIQNMAMPFEYAGPSDVEPLIPLQDELNTRLCDRANRIALQSFKMYLGKGIEHFTDMPVAPGRMWMTDNDRADVIEFGGDANCPSENAHIQDLREALDKASGVTPIAAGAIKGRIGRLTSAAALRITLLALLSRTDRKRTTHGQGLRRMMELALAWLDRAGVLHSAAHERGCELHWPSPLPENDIEKLEEARLKTELGIPRELVLRELGY